ncbi:MAG: rRNA maturation RNase YbeY [Bacteroidota bacterium]|nr:rRNA maturation RNase YbeY [Bacteroidota bacterium]
MRSAKIYFHYATSGFSFTNRKRLKHFLQELFNEEGKKIDTVNYIFCSDEELLAINIKYLGHDFYTDTITFEFSETNQRLFADVYISIERVKENSKEFKFSFNDELHRVIFHSSLHLCGYKDKLKHQVLQMRNKEEDYLNQYFVSRGTRYKH